MKERDVVMKKSELVQAISEKMELSKAEAARRIDAMDVIVETIAETLEVGDKAKIGDYIVVEKKEVPARTGRNPKTGEVLNIAEKVVVKVKATAAAKKL